MPKKKMTAPVQKNMNPSLAEWKETTGSDKHLTQKTMPSGYVDNKAAQTGLLNGLKSLYRFSGPGMIQNLATEKGRENLKRNAKGDAANIAAAVTAIPTMGGSYMLKGSLDEGKARREYAKNKHSYLTESLDKNYKQEVRRSVNRPVMKAAVERKETAAINKKEENVKKVAKGKK